MSHRPNHAAGRQADPTSPKRSGPATEPAPTPRPSPPRPNPWCLAGAVLMETLWLGFLVAMALRR